MAAFTLADELALLAYDDHGTNRMTSYGLGYGLAGALLAELRLAGRVRVDDGRIVVVDHTPIGAPLPDAALRRIAGDEKRHRPKSWVTKLAKDLPGRVLDGLVVAGILRREEGRVLWVFPRTRYPSPGGVEPPVETQVRARVEGAVRTIGPIEPRTAALMALIRATKFEKKAFPDLPRDQIKARLRVAAEGDWVADAVRRAVQDTEAALVAATSSHG